MYSYAYVVVFFSTSCLRHFCFVFFVATQRVFPTVLLHLWTKQFFEISDTDESRASCCAFFCQLASTAAAVRRSRRCVFAPSHLRASTQSSPELAWHSACRSCTYRACIYDLFLPVRVSQDLRKNENTKGCIVQPVFLFMFVCWGKRAFWFSNRIFSKFLFPILKAKFSIWPQKWKFKNAAFFRNTFNIHYVYIYNIPTRGNFFLDFRVFCGSTWYIYKQPRTTGQQFFQQLSVEVRTLFDRFGTFFLSSFFWVRKTDER